MAITITDGLSSLKFWARKEGETNSSDKHKVLENPNWQETKQLAYLHSTAE